jgi:hypothetical protein
MYDAPGDVYTSSVEDLDPEPASAAHLSRTREFLLGLMLLLGVLAWSGWQWRQQETLQGNYRLALQAVAGQDWNAAREYFTAASGYRDADIRGAEAAKVIAERDTQYASAVDLAGRDEWAAALQAAQAVERIEPGYKGISGLRAAAEEQVYRRAVYGTVALRVLVEPPGLYYRGWDGWQWLEGSDRWSRVQGIGPRDHVVYDVPGPGWQPPAAEGGAGNGSTTASGGTPATPRPKGVSTRGRFVGPGSPALVNRRLVAADLGIGSVEFTPLGFDPSRYNFYIWGQRGVWALKYRYGYIPRDLELGAGFVGYEFDYQGYGRREPTASRGAEGVSPEGVSSVVLPGPGWVVMDLARDGEHLLLADLSGEYNLAWHSDGTYRPPAGKCCSLYLAEADGSDPHLLYAQGGGFQRARFSADGRYVLVTAHSTDGNGGSERRSVILVDVRGAATPSVLAEGTTDASSAEFFPSVAATFLDQGAFTGRVLLARWGDGSSNFKIFDPADPASALTTVVVPGHPVGRLWLNEQEGTSGVALAWQEGLGGVLPYAPLMSVVRISPGAVYERLGVPLEDGVVLDGVWLKDGFLVYGSDKLSRLARAGTEREFRVWALGPVHPGAPPVEPSQLNSGTSGDNLPFAFTQEWSLGAGLSAHISGGQLYARSYDGKIDVQLEAGVESFYAFPYEDFHWLR